MKRKEAVKFVVVRSLGNFLLLFSLYGVGITFGPALYYELQYRLIQARGIEFRIENSELRIKEAKEDNSLVAIPKTIDKRVVKTVGPSFLDVMAGAKEQGLTPTDTDFSILIPKIGANVKVYPNIDPTNPEGFLPVLQKGVAHAKGSVFPGMQGNIYLFAHSTDNWWNAGRVNAVFYLLKDLTPGDEIIVFFERIRYDYVVTEKFVTDSTYTDLLSGEKAEKQRLVLQTCWPPGTSWKRLYVLAAHKGG